VVVKVLQSGVGDVTQSDVSLASVSKATIIAFNVAADNPVRLAVKRKVVST
jgi:translation initiation factor IF-2